MEKQLRLVAYNPNWKSDFQTIKQKLFAVLSNENVKILHVGSTSIPGLIAKPIIDIDIVYYEHKESIISKLESIHYTFLGEHGVKDRDAFSYQLSDLPEHHLYLIKHGKEPLMNHLILQYALLNNKKYRLQYQAIKERLFKEDQNDREKYTEGKTDCILNILKEATAMKTIILAGGCFWGVEAYFKQLNGVTDTTVGYVGTEEIVDYNKVCNGSGHAEGVLISYDETKLTLTKLLDHLFNIIDPTSINKQGHDVGIQYRTGIYNYHPEDETLIKNYISEKQKAYTKPIVLEVIPQLVFHDAEEYHQDYLDKNKGGYCHVDLTSIKNVK